MILTTHALVGAAIGKNINNPLIIVPLSLASHYILDFFRHGDYLDDNSKFREVAWKVAFDLSIGLVIILGYLFFSHSSFKTMTNILIGTFFSLLPDLFTLLYWNVKIGFLKKLYDFHNWIHDYFYPKPLIWSLRNAINDILFSSLAIILLLI